MKLFLAALLLVCTALSVGVVAGVYIAAQVNGPAVSGEADKECTSALKSLIGVEDKPTVCR
jgi:hypothetical protein